MEKLLFLFIIIVGCSNVEKEYYLQPYQLEQMEKNIQLCKDRGYEYKIQYNATWAGDPIVYCKVPKTVEGDKGENK